MKIAEACADLKLFVFIVFPIYIGQLRRMRFSVGHAMFRKCNGRPVVSSPAQYKMRESML